MNIGDVLANGLIFLIVPGYTAISFKSYWLSASARPTTATDRLVESLVWGSITYFVASLLGKYVPVPALEKLASGETPGWFEFDGVLLFLELLFLGIALVLLYSWILTWSYVKKILMRTPYARVWDEFWTDNKASARDFGVWLEMKDGTMWFGNFVSVSDSPGEREIWLSNVHYYEIVDAEKNIGVLIGGPGPDMLVHADNIARIFIVDEDFKNRSLGQKASGTQEAPLDSLNASNP